LGRAGPWLCAVALRTREPRAHTAFAAATLFALLAHYRPETREEKKKRLVEKAKAEVKEEAKDDSKKPRMVKYGLKHVTALVEARKAKLVIIAHDVDPIELVVWLPALCRRFDVPYCIVKGKARLGQLIHMKTATCLAVTDVRKEHQAKLQQIIDVVRPLYNEAAADRKKWGGGTLGPKAQAVIRLREKAQVKEAARLAKA
jgi:large subunit ribosomal protein L7Ae